jgi:rubredoxin/uncharacterized membrane protein
MKSWECSVCGYVHQGEVAPEKCPVCEAPQKMFQEKADSAPAAASPVASAAAGGGRRWRCTVCGYIHRGEEPPEKCPACGAEKNMFVEVDADGKTLAGPTEPASPTPAVTPPAPVPPAPAAGGFFAAITRLVQKLHLHPITVHFPNGVLPVAVVFLGLSVYFTFLSSETVAFLETASFYNLLFVLLVLPVVLFTGFIEWQKRYRGAWTALFVTKITCSLVVITGVNVLVFWRLLEPTVAGEGSPYQTIYFGVALATLAAAGIAGHLGGKLVFAGRD